MRALRNIAAAVSVVLAATFPGVAGATLMIAADINGTIFACADQNAACDTNAAVGQLQIANQTIAGVQFLGSAQTQVIGPTNSLNTSSFQFINGNPGTVTLQLAVSGTDFLGPVANFSASGAGTLQSAIGSDIDLTFYGDTANTQGATTPTDLPGAQLADSGVIAATLPTQSIAFNMAGAFVDPDLYSMALGTLVHLSAGGSIVGRSQAIVTEAQPVREASSLAIMGTFIVAGAFAIRRRKRSLDGAQPA